MLTADVLITPLRLILQAFGTGVMPGSDPVSALNAVLPDLESIRASTSAADTTVTSAWSGRGYDEAMRLAQRSAALGAQTSDDGREILTVTTSAAQRVKLAADELSTLVDSFERVVRALGPTLSTPTALATLLPVALDHIARGVGVVERARADLAHDTARLAALTRHEAPAPHHRANKDRASEHRASEDDVTDTGG